MSTLYATGGLGRVQPVFTCLNLSALSLTCAAHAAVQMWSDFPAAQLVNVSGASVNHVKAERSETGRERRDGRHVLGSSHVQYVKLPLSRARSLCVYAISASSAVQIACLALCCRVRGHIRRQKGSPAHRGVCCGAESWGGLRAPGVARFEMWLPRTPPLNPSQLHSGMIYLKNKNYIKPVTYYFNFILSYKNSSFKKKSNSLKQVYLDYVHVSWKTSSLNKHCYYHAKAPIKVFNNILYNQKKF